MKQLILFFAFVTTFLTFFSFGYYIDGYDDIIIRYEKQYDGCWASVQNNGGDWVCVNVYDMSYERCVEVAKHECGHELFAEVCEKDDELCREAQKLLNNYTKR